MITRGIAVWNEGTKNWEEIDFDDPMTFFETHSDFAKDFILKDEERISNYKDYSREIERNKYDSNFKQILDPVDFLLQYYGYVKIGIKIDDAAKFMLYYNEYDNFNETEMGKKRSELINLYRARGFREESSGRLYIPDFVYEMQRDNGLFKHQTPIDLEK